MKEPEHVQQPRATRARQAGSDEWDFDIFKSLWPISPPWNALRILVVRQTKNLFSLSLLNTNRIMEVHVRDGLQS